MKTIFLRLLGERLKDISITFEIGKIEERKHRLEI
jgi:hypothetical protein